MLLAECLVVSGVDECAVRGGELFASRLRMRVDGLQRTGHTQKER